MPQLGLVGPHNPHRMMSGKRRAHTIHNGVRGKVRAPQPTSEPAFLSARESSPELNVLLVRTALNLMSYSWVVGFGNYNRNKLINLVSKLNRTEEVDPVVHMQVVQLIATYHSCGLRIKSSWN